MTTIKLLASLAFIAGAQAAIVAAPEDNSGMLVEVFDKAQGYQNAERAVATTVVDATVTAAPSGTMTVYMVAPSTTPSVPWGIPNNLLATQSDGVTTLIETEIMRTTVVATVTVPASATTSNNATTAVSTTSSSLTCISYPNIATSSCQPHFNITVASELLSDMTRSVTIVPSVTKTTKQLTVTSESTSETKTQIATSTTSSHDTNTAMKTTTRTKVVAPATHHLPATAPAASESNAAGILLASPPDMIRAGLAAAGAFLWLALHLG